MRVQSLKIFPSLALEVPRLVVAMNESTPSMLGLTRTRSWRCSQLPCPQPCQLSTLSPSARTCVGAVAAGVADRRRDLVELREQGGRWGLCPVLMRRRC
jgi:hypothetical protein